MASSHVASVINTFLHGYIFHSMAVIADSIVRFASRVDREKSIQTNHLSISLIAFERENALVKAASSHLMGVLQQESVSFCWVMWFVDRTCESNEHMSLEWTRGGMEKRHSRLIFGFLIWSRFTTRPTQGNRVDKCSECALRAHHIILHGCGRKCQPIEWVQRIASHNDLITGRIVLVCLINSWLLVFSSISNVFRMHFSHTNWSVNKYTRNNEHHLYTVLRRVCRTRKSLNQNVSFKS